MCGPKANYRLANVQHEASLRLVKLQAFTLLTQCSSESGWTIGGSILDRGRERTFLPFALASIPVLRPIQPPVHWVLAALYAGVERPERGADHSPPSNAEINVWSCTSTPVRRHGVVLS
jgi:hypothetical protein